MRTSAVSVSDAPGGRLVSSSDKMLLELDIANYAVAERLRVRFRGGLNLLTGETGSGKSIVVDALSLLLGARGGAELIRAGADKARVAGVFEPEPSAALVKLLDDAGLELEEGELIVERQLQANGKTRVWINGRPTTVSLLRELAPFLGDIHGQHEQQNLFQARTQLEMLDVWAGTEKAAEQTAAVWSERRTLTAKLKALRGDEQERLRLIDLYGFQAREINEARLEPGEDAALHQERNKLVNLSRLQQAAGTAYDALSDSAVSAAAQIRAAEKAVEEISRLDESFTSILETLQASRAGVEDAAFEIQRYLDGLESDPNRLEQIEERLALIEKLKRKYGRTLDEVIAYGTETAEKLSRLTSADADAEAVEKQLHAAEAQFLDLARKLSAKRRAAAKKLEKLVETELADLAMEKARFHVRVNVDESPEGWSADGIDRVVFEFTANPGQPARPLAQVASGGELSRITLALKSCLTGNVKVAESGLPRTLVFDEIDTGVGGRVAEAIGRRLKRLSRGAQVLCVTHLPQIAGFADAHYSVDKVEQNGAVFARMEELSPDRRVDELARMLSGERVTQAALDNARQLLALAADGA